MSHWFDRFHNFAWLGMRILGGVYQWDDGTIVDFVPWKEGDPDYPDAPGQYCVLQIGKTFADRSPWNTAYFICQMGTGSIQLVQENWTGRRWVVLHHWNITNVSAWWIQSADVWHLILIEPLETSKSTSLGYKAFDDDQYFFLKLGNSIYCLWFNTHTHTQIFQLSLSSNNIYSWICDK